jgi:peptidoglycan hydrolase CwlO-like protein
MREEKSELKKKLLTISVASTLGLGILATSNPINIASANSKIDQLNEQQKNIHEKQSEINSKLNEQGEKLNEVKNEQVNVDKEIKRIDQAVGDTETKIKEKELQIEEAEANIETLEEEIKVLETRIANRNELLKDRARTIQENGRVTYFDVLLGAKTFSDFIDRLGAVAAFVEADQNILKEHNADKAELERKQKEVQDTLSKLQKLKQDLEEMKKSLAAQKAEKEKVMASLKQEEEHMHDEMIELEEEKAILAAQKKAMQKAIELEKKRVAEEKRKAEEAAKRASSGGGTAVTAPPISSGVWTRPAAAGYLSSGFGNRSLGDHKGVDIAASGIVPIYAAADGVVIRSYYSTSYGNAVFISHSINGQIYTTVYAHMRNREVSEGQVVSKGQQIGLMGNTGRSYGQHLHFELHRGEWNLSKTNAINPVGIVPL